MAYADLSKFEEILTYSKTFESIVHYNCKDVETKLLHICIDCGGTKTAAVVSTYQNGPVMLSRGYGGPSNYKDNGLRTFLSAIRAAAQEALNAIGDPVVLPTVESILTATNPMEQPPTLLYSAWIGASGVDAAQDVLTLSPLLSRLLGVPLIPSRLMVHNDSHLLSSPLLTAAGPIREAVVAIAGTGSVVVSFRRQRISPQDASENVVHLARAGGWGYLLGDDGSGYCAGREAIREVLRIFNESEVHDTAPPSATGTDTLTSIVLAHFSLKTPEDLFSVIYAPDVFVGGSGHTEPPDWAKLDRKQRIVSLCPLVFHAAFQLKDESALKALKISVSGLVQQISSLCTTAGGQSAGKCVSSPSAILCLGGSLFKVKEYQNLLVEALESCGQRFEQVVYVEDACKEGALGLAKLSS